jgi:hypothetical protein
MGSVWFTLSAGSWRRLRAALGLALLLGLISGTALTAAAGRGAPRPPTPGRVTDRRNGLVRDAAKGRQRDRRAVADVHVRPGQHGDVTLAQRLG